MFAKILKDSEASRKAWLKRQRAQQSDGGKLGYGASLASYGKTTDKIGVTPDDILNSPGISEDDRKEIEHVLDLANSLPPTDEMPEHRTPDGKDWNDERKALHASIISEYLNEVTIARAKPEDGTPPTLVVLGGRGGSGKSAFTHDEKTGEDARVQEFDSRKFIVLDSDAIKARLVPPYEGWNAASVHEESSQIFDKISDRAREMGLNIVHDVTLRSDGLARELGQWQAAGYDIEGHYMHVPRQVSAVRAVHRYLKRDEKGKRGRLVPVEKILENTNNEANFDSMKHFFKKWSAYDNQGEKPVLLTRSKP